MLYNAWSPLIRALRRRTGLTKKAAAARAGVAPITWGRWEKGEIPPRAVHLEGLARTLGRSPQRLGLEYARLLYRHYAKQTGCEDPAAPPSGPPRPREDGTGKSGSKQKRRAGAKLHAERRKE